MDEDELIGKLSTTHPILYYLGIGVLCLATFSWLLWGAKNRRLLADFTGSRVLPLSLAASDYLLLVSLSLLLFSGIPLGVLQLLIVLGALNLWHLRTHSALTYLHLTTREIRPMLFVAGSLALGIYLPLELLAGIMEKILHHLGWQTPVQPAVELFLQAKSWRDLVPLVLMATMAAPMAEEFLFRGLIYPAAKKAFGALAATLVSGFLFAALHQHLASFIPLMLLGMLLCRIFEITGSLWTGILLHAGFNGLTAALLLLARYISHHGR